MIIMFDEIFDRNFQAGRADLFRGIDNTLHTLGRSIGGRFQTKQRNQFDAPWSSKGSDAGCA